MNKFHILTIVIASIILIILLIYAAIQSARQQTLYPPIIPNCPDLWTVDNSGNCIIPSDSKSNIGTLSGKPLYKYDTTFVNSTMTNGYSFLPQITFNGTTYEGTPTGKDGYFSYDIPYGFDPANPRVINFNDPTWGSQGDPNCAIQLWSKQKNITWNGLTNTKMNC